MYQQTLSFKNCSWCAGMISGGVGSSSSGMLWQQLLHLAYATLSSVIPWPLPLRAARTAGCLRFKPLCVSRASAFPLQMVPRLRLPLLSSSGQHHISIRCTCHHCLLTHGHRPLLGPSSAHIIDGLLGPRMGRLCLTGISPWAIPNCTEFSGSAWGPIGSPLKWAGICTCIGLGVCAMCAVLARCVMSGMCSWSALLWLMCAPPLLH